MGFPRLGAPGLLAGFDPVEGVLGQVLLLGRKKESVSLLATGVIVGGGTGALRNTFPSEGALDKCPGKDTVRNASASGMITFFIDNIYG
jgi:hypothetical protein